MEFKQIKPEDIATIIGKNVIMVVTNGTIHYKELPNFGKTNITLTNADGKVMYIEEETKVKTKL